MHPALLENAYYRAKNGLDDDFEVERLKAIAARDDAEFEKEDAYWTAMELAAEEHNYYRQLH